ncbi:MAG: MEDS domain-containing protein [Acidobacteriia bacterium]|nr:MEDS domain-containing protein [Terriglobia bacterium]
MPPALLTHLVGGIPLLQHEHVAVLYRGQAEAYRHAGFLAEGLGRGDLCYYLAPRSYHGEMLARLRGQVPALEGCLCSGLLSIEEGPHDFSTLRKTCQRIFLEAERERAPAVRWLEEGIWPQPAGFPMPNFFEFHALLNYQVKHYPSVALCQYDLNQFEARHLFSAIAVHRHLIVQGTLVRDNPFYIPAEKFIPLSPEERERDLLQLFREVGFEVERLLAALAGYGRLRPESGNP